MTSTRPYTTADLRHEAARQLAALADDRTAFDFDTAIEGRKIPSSDGARTWDQLGDDDRDSAQRAIDELRDHAADLSTWAISIGARGLEPHGEHLTLDGLRGGAEVPLFEIRFAFAADIPETARQALIHAVARAAAGSTSAAGAGTAVTETASP